ncbi:MAG: hypothetical protein BZ151_12850 [Desulfobacca sp. 4484_104]|nr:MAG: hypothetical protein BZ151_12850 [Desulfobacca sp. 4484_104]RLB70989.1 MAG: hypothetical protein DRH04_02615 [Deltaproteobacteria bacterium]
MENDALQDAIHQLEELLERKKAAVPRHSVRPYQLLEIEELEEELLELKKRKKAVSQSENGLEEGP